MLWSLFALHGAAIITIIAVGRSLRDPRFVFAIAAIPATVATVFAATRIGAEDVTARFVWVDQLDLVLAFRIDAISALLTLVVAGIGVAVFVYAAGYFTATSSALPRFAANLSAFSVSMLGLVWADSVWTLFIFWEFTSVTSFLLVGHKHQSEGARLAARRALLITVSGGLVLLAAMVLIADGELAIGLRDLQPMTGPTAPLAAILVLVAAATKSAQVPFHVWLPGAMSAPTPVSAYLHSATMVKAGVVAVALLAPALGGTAVWTPVGVTFGLGSMIWGAIGALRHVDAKLILAWGTISQLGLMIALFSLGSAKAVFAGVSILVAHAVFKAALFMVVGEIDVRAGTRDVRELSGLRSSMPLAFAVAVASSASMAGIPPLLGFPAKEAAVEAALGLDGGLRVVALIGIVGGSVLTVAYTTRFVLAVFGPWGSTERGWSEATVVSPSRLPITIVTAVLGAASLIGYVALGWVTDRVRAASILLDPKSEIYLLYRWPGITTAFVVSAVIVASGLALGAVLTRRSLSIPRPLGADAADGLVAGVLRTATIVAGRVQHGSLPVYLMVAVAVSAAAAVPFVGGLDGDALIIWDRPIDAVVGVLVVGGALATLFVPTRLGSALGLGSVGFGMSAIFVAHGAPDLALTQLLVETVVVVGFVLGFGHLARRLPPDDSARRPLRVVISVAGGLAVMAGLAAAASNPSGQPPLDRLTERAVVDGGGNNLVNVILTDVRALDTFGEILVLVAVAVGVAALARAPRPERRAGADASTGGPT